MKVTSVVVTPVAFADPPLLNAVGVHEPYALRAVVEVGTDTGAYGLGESYGDAAHLELLRAVADELPGLDPFDLNELSRRVDAIVGGRVARDAHGLIGEGGAAKTVASVTSPFEVACHDLQGKHLGRPVSDLLGGATRDRIDFCGYLFAKWAAHPGHEPDEWGPALDPAGLVAQARLLADRFGFRSFKLKGGVLPPDDEIAAIRALREAFPGHPLRLDPNASWDPETAARVADELTGVLEYLEDPVAGIPAMADLARTAPMPLATNMCVVTWEHLTEAIAARPVGVLLGDHHFWGGLKATQHVATACHHFGIGMSMHSNSHLGISLAAMVHLAAATPAITHDLDTHWPWKRPEDDVVTTPWHFVDGAITVPRTPGLGVDLDRDALDRLHQQYLVCGLTRRDDTGYLARVAPDVRLREDVHEPA
ncbi:enolase C-terminal domain-like protein [Streptomyces aureus]|uniref:enolase C-terminal domain-like protein n=1 Tax=Streptomyces aureus TaxID=193461 RepID=UPI0006E44C6B|nr:enolase C-terminal domain-like protein [Streptomyces aureus]